METNGLIKQKMFKGSVFLTITFAKLAIALSPDDTAAAGYSLELVQGSNTPLIDRSNPGSAGNRNGYEGGTAFMYKSEFHLFVTEEMTGTDLTRTGHWKSNNGTSWIRVGTVQNSVNIPNNPRHAIWSPMPVYNSEEGRWNIFYVGYEQHGTYHGRVFRAYSSINGYDGLNGPYTDTAGTVLSYADSNKHPWEGDQGADSFYVYRSSDKWWGFYGSAGTSSQWCVGLASASSLAGVWSRVANAHATFSYAENPIVTSLDDHTYFCVFDDLAHGLSNCHSIGYGYSNDGANWTTNYLNFSMPGWATNIRTPQSLISAGNNEYWIYFTANTASGFDCMGRIRVRLEVSK